MLDREKWYTTGEVAAAVGVHEETVRRWIRAGRLPAKRQFVGNVYRVKGADVLERVDTLQERDAHN